MTAKESAEQVVNDWGHLKVRSMPGLIQLITQAIDDAVEEAADRWDQAIAMRCEVKGAGCIRDITAHVKAHEDDS